MARAKKCKKCTPAIQREKQEPRVGLEPLSLWLIGVARSLFFGGAISGATLEASVVTVWIQEVFRQRKRRGGQNQQQQAAELSPAERGKKVFAAELCGLPPGKRARIAKPGLSAAGRF